ncbi:uncharacterized protein ACA1_305910 [Acanthamoeba castellanii str. Neff]|uniref:Uncharacterized protein n=1 Tax=Acanthamoeba castellanii (strain ATCC 30010 / Neff) TaxID=1257118 RepID=L8GKK9_ACACF|nr:uncharacterized protein ACA1_305910 [Acanthamoeba castellanii str. Neff]ELR13557.1 hypothetical protein ACA1_305910 [Acanthamoeba castellanii str. Neff]
MPHALRLAAGRRTRAKYLASHPRTSTASYARLFISHPLDHLTMPVSGALTQLSAQGPQNRYLTIDLQITYWKGSVRRHSHFAVAEIDNGVHGATG